MVERTTDKTLMKNMREKRHIFTFNRTRLKIVGLERIGFIDAHRVGHSPFLLEEVTSLYCSFKPFSTAVKGGYILPMVTLGRMFSNLQTLNLSNMPSQFVRCIGFLFKGSCPFLNKIIWKNCDQIWFCGSDFEHLDSLTHLDLDGSAFYTPLLHEDPNYFLLMKCRRLERLSMSGATQMLGPESVSGRPHKPGASPSNASLAK